MGVPGHAGEHLPLPALFFPLGIDILRRPAPTAVHPPRQKDDEAEQQQPARECLECLSHGLSSMNDGYRV